MKASKLGKLSTVLPAAAIALIGLVIGGFSAWHLADRPPPGGQTVTIGPWEAQLGIASASVDPGREPTSLVMDCWRSQMIASSTFGPGLTARAGR